MHEFFGLGLGAHPKDRIVANTDDILGIIFMSEIL